MSDVDSVLVHNMHTYTMGMRILMLYAPPYDYTCKRMCMSTNFSFLHSYIGQGNGEVSDFALHLFLVGLMLWSGGSREGGREGERERERERGREGEREGRREHYDTCTWN